MKGKFMQALLGLLLMAPSAVLANDAGETPAQALVLKFADDTETWVFLADKPEVVFADGKLTVSSPEMTTDYDQSLVTEFYFDNRSTPAAIAEAEKQKPTFVFTDNNTVSVTGSHASSASLYTADGTLIQHKDVKNGAVSFSLKGCKAGVYVLNIQNEQTYKLIKK